MKILTNKREMGTVMWFCSRDKNGIIKDCDGNEHYVDVSVIKNRALLNSGQVVTFLAHRESGTLVAREVE